MLVMRGVVVIYYYSSLISYSAEYARLFKSTHLLWDRPKSQQNQGVGYIRRQIHEHVFPVVRYLHLSPKAKR